MSTPPLAELEAAAAKIVWGAQKNGNLQAYTPRLIRQTIEKEYSLNEGTLDSPEYKSAIKAATKAALDKGAPTSKVSGGTPKAKAKESPKRKRKSSGKVKDESEEEDSASTPKTKGKGKAAAKKDSNDDDGDIPRKKRKTAKPKKAKSDTEEEDEDSVKPTTAPAPKSRPKLKDTKFKSAEHVPTSDMEQDEPDHAGSSPSKPSSSKAPMSPQSKPSSTAKANAESAKTKKPAKDKKDEHSKDGVQMEDAGEKSESELSVLMDDPPKRKRKSKAGEKEPKKASSKSKKEVPTLSKDEENIKRLKALVVACGTRKVWSKVFQGLDTPQQQIKKLKEMLAELGMTGRLSLEQAKTIKEKRELAQELEDVQAFASAMEGRSTRSRGKGTVSKNSDQEDNRASDEEAASSEEDEEGAAPRKRPGNAKRSIMAFLEDQSDDE